MPYELNGRTYFDEADYRTALKKTKNRYNSYEPWSKSEDESLLKAYDNGLSISDLADLHKRTKGAIRSRLNKLRPEIFQDHEDDILPPVYKDNIMLQVVEDLEILYNKELIHQAGIPTNFASYINSLKPELEKFQNAIQPKDIEADVRMPYENKSTQIIYALKYFHAYWYQIYQSLEKIKESLLNRQELRIALFCAGPAPEIIGITKFLEENPHNFSSIEIHLYDQINQWSYARDNFIFSNGKKQALKQNHKMSFIFHEIDLTNLNDLNAFSTLHYYDLISFQNCIGEFSQSSKDDSSKNFLKVLRSLKPNSYAIFSERNIKGTEKNISRIHEFASENTYEMLYDSPYTYYSLKEIIIPIILCNGNFYNNPDHSKPGLSAMNQNRFKTIILKKGPKKIRVWLKSKADFIQEELGVFKDLNTAKKSAEKAKAEFKRRRAEAVKFEKGEKIKEKEELRVSQEVEENVELEKIDLPDNWQPNYGNLVYHRSLGQGIIRKIIKSSDRSTSELIVTKIGIDFEEHGNLDIQMPTKDLKLLV